MGTVLETLHEDPTGKHYKLDNKSLSLRELLKQDLDDREHKTVNLSKLVRLPTGEHEIEQKQNQIPVEDRGVHCQALMFLLRRCAPEGDWRNRRMTIRELVTLVRRDTLEWHCCGAELLKYMCKPMESDKDFIPMVGKPSVFVSYSWDVTARRILNDLCWQYGDGEKQKAFKSATAHFWIDIMAINQHTPTELDKLQQVINTTGTVWLYLDPTAKAISRIWVLYEMLCTVRVKTNRLRIIFGEECWEVAALRALSILMGALDYLDVAKAEATQEEDRKRILEDVAKSPGIKEMNETLIKAFKECAQEDLLSGFGRGQMAFTEEMVQDMIRLIKTLGGWKILYHEEAVSKDSEHAPIGALWYWWLFKTMDFPEKKEIWKDLLLILESSCISVLKEKTDFADAKAALVENVYKAKQLLYVGRAVDSLQKPKSGGSRKLSWPRFGRKAKTDPPVAEGKEDDSEKPDSKNSLFPRPDDKKSSEKKCVIM